MSRRIDIELTSSREDGSWTWRAAGAREPKGTLDGALLPSGAEVGSVLRAEIEGFLDGLSVVAVLPPRAPRSEPQRLEIKTSGSDQPLVTSTLAPKRAGERGRRNDRGRDRREGRGGRDEGGEGTRERRGGRTRDRKDARHERPSRPAPPPVEAKPKPKRLRPGKAHRTALLEAVPAEQRPIAEQLLAGGIPSVRQAIEKQNAELRSAGKPEVKPDALLKVAEDLRPRALAAVWRDRAEAAAAVIDDLDLRDLRSVVNAAGDAGRDDEARALATQLREALTVRVEKEQATWLAELAETVRAGRVVRALRLSSRPPKAGAPIPGDIATQLAEATAASLTDETGPDRWATVLDALAYSPVRRRIIPQSLPAKLTPELRATIARLAGRLPEIAHIFDIEPDPAAERAARGQARRRTGDRKEAGRTDGGRREGGRTDGGRREGGRTDGGRKDGGRKDGARAGGGRKGGDRQRKGKAKSDAATAEAPSPGPVADEAGAAEAGESPPATQAEAPTPGMIDQPGAVEAAADTTEADAPDTVASEAATADAGTEDAATDTGTPDAGTPDAGAAGAATENAVTDAGTPDAGTIDASTEDAAADAGTPDAGAADTPTEDAAAGANGSAKAESGTEDGAAGANGSKTAEAGTVDAAGADAAPEGAAPEAPADDVSAQP